MRSDSESACGAGARPGAGARARLRVRVMSTQKLPAGGAELRLASAGPCAGPGEVKAAVQVVTTGQNFEGSPRAHNATHVHSCTRVGAHGSHGQEP